MNEHDAQPEEADVAHLAQLGRGEVEVYRRALETRGVKAFVLPLRACDGPT